MPAQAAAVPGAASRDSQSAPIRFASRTFFPRPTINSRTPEAKEGTVSFRETSCLATS